jgi:hypothetical protein
MTLVNHASMYRLTLSQMENMGDGHLLCKECHPIPTAMQLPNDGASRGGHYQNFRNHVRFFILKKNQFNSLKVKIINLLDLLYHNIGNMSPTWLYVKEGGK